MMFPEITGASSVSSQSLYQNETKSGHNGPAFGGFVSQNRGLRAIAIFEGAKGLFILLVGFELLHLLGTDVQESSSQIVHHLGLDHGALAGVFRRLLDNINDSSVLMMAGVALLYALLRLIEAVGLWFAKAWAEWLAILSGSLYVPIEMYKLIQHPTWIRIAITLGNLALVYYLIRVRGGRRSNLSPPQPF
ncbi:DUF2127 domain-containing protein [Bdellovibrio bacteriovorus]|uniref:DUF2127 domain-containing protein n=1 Tax=Bdellovibrio bacteriovorus TaxID=959 RepID=UPI0035A72691